MTNKEDKGVLNGQTAIVTSSTSGIGLADSRLQPNKRFVILDELANLTVFLCSPAATSITGIALPIEGGWTAR